MAIYVASRALGVVQTSRKVARRGEKSSFRPAMQVSPPEIASPADIGVYLSAATPEALVAALDNPASCEQAESEFNERLGRTPKANQCAFRFLRGWAREHSRPLTSQENADVRDAFDGLQRICFKAIGDLWLPGDTPPLILIEETDKLVRTDRALTRFFISERIWDFLLSFRERSEQDLLLLALNREFSHLPGSVRCDLIDEIRKAYAKKKTSEGVVVLFLDPSDLPEPTDPSAFHDSPDEHDALELLNVEKSEFIEAIGPKSYETLVTLVDFATCDDLPDSKQARKSAGTAAIASKHGISHRQARARKQDLYARLHDAQRKGVPIVRALYQTLRVTRTPEDKSESVLTVEQNDAEVSDETTPTTAVLDEICE